MIGAGASGITSAERALSVSAALVATCGAAATAVAPSGPRLPAMPRATAAPPAGDRRDGAHEEQGARSDPAVPAPADRRRGDVARPTGGGSVNHTGSTGRGGGWPPGCIQISVPGLPSSALSPHRASTSPGR